MAALESQAVTTDQGNSSICVCAALAMAATEALDDVGIDTSQRDLQAALVNKSNKPVTEGRWPTEYNGTGIRFQDPKSMKWFYATIGASPSSFEKFKKNAQNLSGGKNEQRTKGTNYVIHWNSPYGPHCVYSREWLPTEGKVKCMNSWGKVEEEPHLRPDQIAQFFSVVLVVQEQNEEGPIVAITSFPEFKPPKGNQLSSLNTLEFPSEALSLLQQLQISFKEAPLTSPQPEFEHDGRVFTNCRLIHRLLVLGRGDEVLRRRKELPSNPTLASSSSSWSLWSKIQGLAATPIPSILSPYTCQYKEKNPVRIVSLMDC